MGSCWCKEKLIVYVEDPNALSHTPGYERATDDLNNARIVNRLVLETLEVIGTLVDNEQEPPRSMQSLHFIADNEDGWLQVVKSMVAVIPMADPLGPSVITLLLDDCPLPSRESVLKVSQLLDLSAESAARGRADPARERNVCVVLGCIAEKLAGPSSVCMLTDGTLDYLVANLAPDTDPHVTLFSLIALEKFAQTSENKAAIKRRLKREASSPLLVLERWQTEEHFVRRQVGLCAQWCLDNLFLMEGRRYSYEAVDMSGINAMLNTADASEYLKILPDGLEARCDAYSFESVRCTAQADRGAWYYEVTVVTPGIMQIGWATRDSSFLNHEGYGIGDDQFSLAYDGCRRLIWHDARAQPHTLPRWQPGDVLGCLLDLDAQRAVFSLNGRATLATTHLFEHARAGFFAAASFMSFQQCRFNFGAEPFRFAPAGGGFLVFNEHGALAPEDKRVMPRHIFLDELRRHSVRDDCCTLCFDKKASVRLVPCDHTGFCATCAKQLTECPMCRSAFLRVDLVSP